MFSIHPPQLQPMRSRALGSFSAGLRSARLMFLWALSDSVSFSID
jgi:hypothetical protein